MIAISVAGTNTLGQNPIAAERTRSFDYPSKDFEFGCSPTKPKGLERSLLVCITKKNQTNKPASFSTVPLEVTIARGAGVIVVDVEEGGLGGGLEGGAGGMTSCPTGGAETGRFNFPSLTGRSSTRGTPPSSSGRGRDDDT